MYPWTNTNAIAVDAKKLSKERFLELHPIDKRHEYLYDILVNSAVGHISIKQISGNKVGFTMEGVTATFAEGISLFIDDETTYYYTSVVQKIDWENGRFYTLNSCYEFTFDAISKNEL